MYLYGYIIIAVIYYCGVNFQGYVLLMRNASPTRNVTMGIASTLVKWKKLVELTHYVAPTIMFSSVVVHKVLREIKTWNA